MWVQVSDPPHWNGQFWGGHAPAHCNVRTQANMSVQRTRRTNAFVAEMDYNTAMRPVSKLLRRLVSFVGYAQHLLSDLVSICVQYSYDNWRLTSVSEPSFLVRCITVRDQPRIGEAARINSWINALTHTHCRSARRSLLVACTGPEIIVVAGNKYSTSSSS